MAAIFKEIDNYILTPYINERGEPKFRVVWASITIMMLSFLKYNATLRATKNYRWWCNVLMVVTCTSSCVLNRNH